MSTDKKMLDNRYAIQTDIDSGVSAKVYVVLDTYSGETKAAKIYSDNARIDFQKEIQIYQILQKVNLPGNIRCYSYGEGYLTQNEISEKKMFAILEYGEHGNLFNRIFKRKNGFSEDVCKFILLKILDAVEALHNQGLCHRDIKPENIVLTGDNYDLKLIDFGVATTFINSKNKKKKLNRKVGTPYYAAPEILERRQYEGDKVDIFSIGALLFVLMTRKFAFAKAKIINDAPNSKKILYGLIKDKNYDKYWENLDKYFDIKNVPEEFRNLFVKMVAYNPEERPSIIEIRNDAWMSDVNNANEEKLTQLREKMIEEFLDEQL